MRISRIGLVAVLAVIGAFVAWAAAPLLLRTTADVPRPETFTTIVKAGRWSGVDGFHFANGVAMILGDGRGAFLLRVEDFAVRNGPDIHFFLSADGTVGTGDLDLGSVPATEGSYHVAIPAGFDPDEIGFALVQCVPATFLFARAPLA